MPIIIRGQEGDFQPAPPGLHQAVCVDVVDLGVVDGKFGPKRQLKIVWQLKTRNQKNERFQVRATYTQSLNEKSNLRRDLESWRGRPFTREEIREFDAEKMLGANCQIQVAQRVSAAGRTYANAQAIVPLHKGMEKLVAENYEREPWPDHDDVIQGEVVQDEPAEYFDSDVPF